MLTQTSEPAREEQRNFYWAEAAGMELLRGVSTKERYLGWSWKAPLGTKEESCSTQKQESEYQTLRCCAAAQE